MICLEMIGYFTDEAGSQEFPLPDLGLLYPNRGNFIAVVGKPGQGSLTRRVRNRMRSASALPVHSINAKPLERSAGHRALALVRGGEWRKSGNHELRSTRLKQELFCPFFWQILCILRKARRRPAQ